MNIINDSPKDQKPVTLFDLDIGDAFIYDGLLHLKATASVTREFTACLMATDEGFKSVMYTPTTFVLPAFVNSISYTNKKPGT